MSLDLSFPIRELLIFVTQHGPVTLRAEIHDLVTDLAASREWVIGPPRFVDIVQESGDSDDDVPFETVGGVLEIYSNTPPTVLPREIDLQHLEEVSALVKAVGDFSREHRVAFEFELDGDWVGTVDDGEMGNGLEDGFLGEWRRHIGVPD